jgi:acetyl esterase/lipase
MTKAGKDVAIFVLSYTLVPHGTYPTQLQQAVACLRYILDETGRSPANIYLGGDSAGGNLVMGVLSHLSHPHPEIESLSIQEDLAGAALVAPWTDLRTDFPPPETQPLGDLITQDVAKVWATAYLGGRTRDYYTDASSAPSEWWNGLKVKDVMIIAGEYEILLPIIEDFTQKLKVLPTNSSSCFIIT